MSIEAMKQALEALEFANVNYWWGSSNIEKAIASLRQAIEQAKKQEPLEYWNAVEGWVKIDEVRQHFDSVGCGTIYKNNGEDRVPLYATPQREWVGLTDEEIALVCAKCAASAHNWNDISFAHAIEAKLKDKNHVS